MDMFIRRGAAVVAVLVTVGCSSEPAHHASIMDVLANPSSSAKPTPTAAAPVAAPLGTAESARGMTVTPRADNLVLTHQSQSDQQELGIEISISGATAPLETTGFNAGLRLDTSNGEELRPVPPTVLTMPPLPSPVSGDADGWVFFHVKPDAQPTQLRLMAAAAASYYGPSGQPIGIWTMPATLPSPAPAPEPVTPEPATTDPGNAPRTGPHPRHNSPFCRLTHLC
jgi:hypothetical protein